MTLGEQDRIRIEPVDIRVRPSRYRSPRKKRPILAGLAAVAAALVALAAAGYAVMAQRVTFSIDPLPDTLTLNGGWIRPHWGGTYLLWPGTYRLEAHKEGYHALDRPVEISIDSPATLEFSLRALDGFLSVEVVGQSPGMPQLEDADVTVNGGTARSAPVRNLALAPGAHEVEARAPRYQTVQTNVVVAGQGREESIRIALPPGWATVQINAVPAGARVAVEEEPRGEVPLTLELDPGTHRVTVAAEGFQSFSTQLVARAGDRIRLDDLRLEEAEARLRLRTRPAGALVSVDAQYRGATPLDLAVRPRVSHDIILSKAGFRDVRRTLTASPGETIEWTEELPPVTGVVRFDVTPPDAELVVDGAARGPPPKEVEWTAVEHRIELRKDGYRTHQERIRPKPGHPLLVSVELTPVGESDAGPGAAASAGTLTAAGHVLLRVEPGSFRMGASRREQGRRSNETLVDVELSRPFFFGIKEVTNAEFRRFRSDHGSGRVRDHSLNRDDQPVVNVSWADAARYCNWLSAQEGLPEVYRVEGDDVTAKHPLPEGYRLPTEAEWAYCARAAASGELRKYPWGDGFPPPPAAGNFADRSAASLLARTLPDYTDGYAVTAPPGSFDPGPRGMYDLGGNVAEWCHDVYDVYEFDPDRTLRDPTGPPDGAHHVIRGSSWKDATITALRLSYRAYGNQGRDDVGFRVGRYVSSGNAS